MRVYHFLNEQYGLDALRHQRLKLAEIMELNDPFEFLSVEFSDKDVREAFKGVKLRLAEKYGLLCFSKNWSNTVQWAHYADNHKGLCLGFDFLDNKLMKVSYAKERLDRPVTSEDINIDLMNKVLSTKYSDWEYEKEHRVFVSKEIKSNGLYFSDFSEDFKLKEIIVGARSDITRDGIHKILGDNKSDIKIIDARAAFKSFKMVEQKNKKLWK